MHTCGKAMGDNGHNGKERETRHREGGHVTQHRHTSEKIMGNTWRQGKTRHSGRRAHHPTKGNMKGQRDTEERTPVKGDRRSRMETIVWWSAGEGKVKMKK